MNHRDYYFDNAKFILIFLVVFGHAIRPMIDYQEFALALYKVIYSFHMPAFILISGFFARGILQKGYVTKITKKLIYPYIMFQTIYTIYYFFLYSRNHFSIDFFQPQWSLWFLLSLIFWHLLLIGFIRIGKVIGLIIAIVVGLVVGYLDWVSSFLSLSRTFVFFPFFLAGYYLRTNHFIWLLQPKVKYASLLVYILIFVLFYFLPELNEKWLLGSKPYSQLESLYFLALLKRAGVYIINFVMVAAFFTLVPKQKLYISKLGRNTLYVYLLHGFFIKFWVTNVSFPWRQPAIIAGVAVLSFLLSVFLANKEIIKLVNPLIVYKKRFNSFLIDQNKVK